MNKIKLLITGIITSVLFSACWPEDEPIEPFPSKTLPYSFYDHQIYYSLEQDSVVSVNLLDAWDIGFESGVSGYHIIINSGNQLAIANMGAIDINSILEIPDNPNWIYDASSGNLDSTAIGNWIDLSVIPHSFSNQVFILARNSGQVYVPEKKIKFIDWDEQSYTLLLADISSQSADTFIIKKNNQVNFTKVSVTNGIEIKNIEPDKNKWDLLFTQYGTILYTDAGTPVQYLVRGVIINSYRVSVAKTLTANENDFYKLDSTSTESLFFFKTWDIIGYNWKDVYINESGTSAEYVTLPNKVYFVRYPDETIYKLRFLDFYNTEGKPGYIGFEYDPLQDFK